MAHELAAALKQSSWCWRRSESTACLRMWCADASVKSAFAWPWERRLGVAIGIGGALLLGRVMAKLVFGVKTTDPATFASVSGLLVLVALLAITVPAYRATQVDPMRTLRDK
ncbi:MAG TPA: hypothetical protein VFR24_10370 [Candidatus Angelobacter sp.]|nr:hypothetical protein [Candidatus Angelobacter sp.]